jgi:DNA-binding CsgD family transcriptional regulator
MFPVQQSVTLQDLQRVVDLGSLSRVTEQGAPIPWSVFKDLSALVPCDSVEYQAYDPYRHRDYDAQVFADDGAVPLDSDDVEDDEASRVFWSHFWSWPCSYPERTGDTVSLRRTSEFPLATHAAGTLADYYRLAGVRYCFVLPLRPICSISHRLVFWRVDGRDFSERETLLLALARPHLAELHDLVLRRRDDAPVLTARQNELVRLLAAGLTNRQIARHLQIAEGTVRKHLENIYSTLGVTNRLEAVEHANNGRR